MQFLITLLFLASTTLSLPVGTSFDALMPGLTVGPECRKFPSGNTCPAKLRSSNALITSQNIIVSEQGKTSAPNNILIRAGFTFSAPDNRLLEESTLTVFDFPAGHTDKRCRFQFISDGGDRLDTVTNIYNVWSFVEGSGEASVDSTFETKPKRNEVLATFTTANAMYVTENEKSVHQFLFGPGEGAPVFGEDDGTFACPDGGKIGFEVASAIKSSGLNETMNVGGASGLGIEIVGLASLW